MSVDDLMIAITIAGIGLTVAYLRAEFISWRRAIAAERRKRAGLRDPRKHVSSGTARGPRLALEFCRQNDGRRGALDAVQCADAIDHLVHLGDRGGGRDGDQIHLAAHRMQHAHMWNGT
jgi:hypothetical protein